MIVSVDSGENERKTVEKGDYVVFNYVGMYENGEVFDTSVEELAKKEGVFVEGKKYKPMRIKAGSGEVIPGIDEAIIGMKVGEKKRIEVPPEKGYGMPRPELIVDVPREEFSKAGIEPVEGMYVGTDSGPAKIVKIEENTVKLDFNHPLAGKTTVFEIEIVGIEKDEG